MDIKIWAAITSPFFENGSLDEESLRYNIEEYIRRGIYGVFFNGLMGENWSLSLDEHKLIQKTIISSAKGRLKVCPAVMAGTTDDTIELGLHAKKLGADYVSLITPSTPQNKEQLLTYMRHLMEKIDMPFVLFNAATPAHSVLTPEIFSDLCQNENLKILKTSASDEVNNSLRAVARHDIAVSDPTEEKFYKNMSENGQPILFADPEPYLYQDADFRPIEKYVSLFEGGDTVQARVVFDSIAPLRKVFNKWIMQPFYQGVKINSYLKKWADIVGLKGGYSRRPCLPLAPEEKVHMEKDIIQAKEKVRETLNSIQ